MGRNAAPERTASAVGDGLAQVEHHTSRNASSPADSTFFSTVTSSDDQSAREDPKNRS